LEHDDLVDPVVRHAQIDLALHAVQVERTPSVLQAAPALAVTVTFPPPVAFEHDLSLDRGMNAPMSTASLRLTKTQTSSSPVKLSVYCLLVE